MRQRAEMPWPFDAATSYPGGERLLMLATLEDGIRTILQAGSGGADARRVADDVAWLTSEDRCPPFSFLNLCEFLGIDPDYLRSRVLMAYLRRMPPSRRTGSRSVAAARAVRRRPLRRDRPH